MRISADNHVSRQHQPLLGQKHVLDAHLAHFKIDYSLLPGKLPHQLRLLGGSNILIGHKVVRHHHHLLRVKDLTRPDLPKLPYRDRGRNIIGQDKVYGDIYKLAGGYLLPTGMSRKYLLN